MLSEPGTQAMGVSFSKLTSPSTHPDCQIGKPQTAPRAEEIQALVLEVRVPDSEMRQQTPPVVL